MRIKRLLREVLGLSRGVVVCGWELDWDRDERPVLRVEVRDRVRRRGRCGRCGERAAWYDRGGGRRMWRHLDVAFARCVLVADARRVDCLRCGPTVAALPWARHDSAFTYAFDDVVVWEALASSKQAAADRYGVTWRAADNACVRVASEALGCIDLLDGLVAIGIDEVKYKKGQKYLTVVCDHVSGRVVWAGEGRSKKTVRAFFDALGDARTARLQFVSCDGAEWIRTVLAERAPQAEVCLDTWHVIKWATDALDTVRRSEWNRLRQTGRAGAAKALKGLRWLLLRNWENLTGEERATIRDLDKSNRRLLRAWQLKEELRDIFGLGPVEADAALDDWLHYASRSKLEPFVKLARTIRRYRTSILATIEWGFTNGLAESVNAAIGRLRTNARGYHHPDSLIAMIYLDRSGIAPD
ncbi:MAG: ISL3 family transposase, partial [Hyphomicrobiaceae bacterium]